MTRKTSAYARKRAKQPQLLNKAYAEEVGRARFLDAIRHSRPYADDAMTPGDAECIAPNVAAKRTEVMLQLHSALDGLLSCRPPVDPFIDFTRLKHAMQISAIRTIEMIYGNKKRDIFPRIDLTELNQDQRHAAQLIYDANKALNRAYDRWKDGKGYGLDGEGRVKLVEAVELYEVIFLNSTPKQIQHAHEQAMLALQESEVAA
jgi:hypothetical protein